MTYEYTTPALVKSELRATQDFSATTIPTKTTIDTWISEESAYINFKSGQTFGSNSYTEVLDYNGEDRLLLEHAPIISVTSVLYSTSPLGTSTYGLSETQVDGVDYTTYDKSGEIVILPSGWNPSIGRKRIEVTYTAGNETTPLHIQKLATKLIAKRAIDTLMEKDIHEKASGKSISVGSVSIVKPANFGVESYKNLIVDIGQLTKEIVGGTGVYRIPTHRY